LDTRIIRIEIQLPGMDAFSKPMRLPSWICSKPGVGRGVVCAFVFGGVHQSPEIRRRIRAP
jgi:hypothetical protein